MGNDRKSILLSAAKFSEKTAKKLYEVTETLVFDVECISDATDTNRIVLVQVAIYFFLSPFSFFSFFISLFLFSSQIRLLFCKETNDVQSVFQFRTKRKNGKKH